MHASSLRRSTLLVLLVTLLAAVPSYAGKRRAVRHPSAGEKLIATVTGKVLDAVTGAPVIGATVNWHNGSASTNAAGEFTLRNIYGYGGKIEINAERSGYTAQKHEITAAGNQTVEFRLQPKPTVRVKLVNDIVLDIDLESLEFGYAVAFSGYIKEASEDFCRPDGSAVRLHRSEMKKITGPGTLATHAPCCASTNVLKVNVELKSGGAGDYYFAESCQNANKMDLIGRDHTSGQFHYIRFEEIAEVVFP